MNYCGEKENQSPINLLSPIGHYGRAYGKYLNKEADAIEKTYSDVRKKVPVTWATNTVKVSLEDEVNSQNFFKSQLAKT